MRCSLVALFLCLPAFAYNPPADTAGPLTVRIDLPALGAYGAGGLAEFNRAGAPVSLPVTVENASGAALQGTVRLRVIDRWKAVPESLPVTLAPHGRARLEFRISFAAGTYNADYPLHAYAEFPPYAAHAVLIVKTALPDPPRAQVRIPWKPVQVPAHGSLELWKVGVRQVSETVASAVPRDIDFGRENTVTARLGVHAPAPDEQVRSVTVAYFVDLPATRPLRLHVRTSGAGARFRVLVDGAVQPSGEAVDLDSFAGRAVKLELEAAGSGAARWIEPRITAGEPLATVLPPRTLGTIRVTPGARGLLDAKVDFGRISFQGFRVRIFGEQCQFLDARAEPAAGHYRVRHRYQSWAGDFDLLVDLWTERDTLRARFALENKPPAAPWADVHIEQVAAGPWSAAAQRVYAGEGNVIQSPGAFTLGFDGHRLATSYVGFDFPGIAMLQATNAIPDRLAVDPARHIYTLETPHDQTLTFLPAANVWEAVRAWRALSGKHASAGVPQLAGRFVFDLWHGQYASAAQALEQAFRYGLTDAVVVWHNWQRWGYDYRLPDIYPPSPQNGSDADFRRLVETCRQAGVLFAPHDNYIDFYPDSDGFTYDNIVFTPAGAPQRAWFNNGRQAQAYRSRPDRLRPFVERNLTLIRDGLAPTAYFIDVWSSAPPYDYWTADGRFTGREETRRVWGETFDWIRDFLGGAPQISEAGHDQLIGHLDGSQAQFLRVDTTPGRQFVWPVACGDAERIPWLDAAYHDIFVQHGAGYPGRYAGGLDERAHGVSSDDYISVEVLAGHPAMVAAPFGRDVVRKYWLLHDLMRALALRRIASVEFAAGDIHRQHVRWDNGADVWVNRGAADWQADGHVLPQYGFYARFAGGEAAIERLDGAVVEWARGGAALYVNARDAHKPIAFPGGVTTDSAFRKQGGESMPLP